MTTPEPSPQIGDTSVRHRLPLYLPLSPSPPTDGGNNGRGVPPPNKSRRSLPHPASSVYFFLPTKGCPIHVAVAYSPSWLILTATSSHPRFPSLTSATGARLPSPCPSAAIFLSITTSCHAKFLCGNAFFTASLAAHLPSSSASAMPPPKKRRRRKTHLPAKNTTSLLKPPTCCSPTIFSPCSPCSPPTCSPPTCPPCPPCTPPSSRRRNRYPLPTASSTSSSARILLAKRAIPLSSTTFCIRGTWQMSVPTEKRVKRKEGLILFLYTCCALTPVGMDPKASFPSWLLLSCCRRGFVAEKRGRCVARRRGRGGRVRRRGRILSVWGSCVGDSGFARGLLIWFLSFPHGVSLIDRHPKPTLAVVTGRVGPIGAALASTSLLRLRKHQLWLVDPASPHSRHPQTRCVTFG